MKLIRIILILLAPFVLVKPSWASLEDEINNINNSIVKVHNTFIGIKELKNVSFGSAGVTELKNLSWKFDKLTINPNYEGEWETYVEKNGIYKWPRQTVKQAVGGNLFYPKEVVGWVEDAIFMNHLLERKDVLWSFAIAARYKDPRGMLHLFSALHKIWTDNYFKDSPDYYGILNKKAQEKLELATDSPEVLYILGDGYITVGACFGFDLKKSEHYFNQILESTSKADDKLKAKAEIQLLRMKATYRKAYEAIEAPNVEDFRKVAVKYRCGRALATASNFIEDDREKEALLTEAIEMYHYIPAYIKRGILRKRDQHLLAEQDFVEAGKNGMTIGFIKAGSLLLRTGETTPDEKSLKDLLKKYSKEEVQILINKVSTYFIEALDRGEPLAADYLASLHGSWHKLTKEKGSISYYAQAVEKGLNLGSASAYNRIDCFKEKKRAALSQNHGKAPHKDLWKEIKAFIEAK